MTSGQIQSALSDIRAETDPTLKHLKLASLVSGVFRERGVELAVVGGSAIECYTDGAYVSVDVDLRLWKPGQVDLRTRQEIMGRVQARGGPRSWEDSLKGRRARRETGNRVAPEIIRRTRSSSDRRLRRLFQGERGLPFRKTDEL